MKALLFVSVLVASAPALADGRARAGGGQPVNGQPITPSSVTSPLGKFDVLDAGTALINGQLQVSGPVVASSTISAAGAVIANSGLFRLLDSNTNAGLFSGSAEGTTTNSANVRGDVANSAGNTAITGTNVTSMTVGMDRYLWDLSPDNGTTKKFRVTTNGTPINAATVGTAASGTGITANYSGAVTNFLHKVTVINTALAAAATSDVTLAVTPANSRIVRVTADVTQVFTGGSLSAMTVTCGNAAGGNQYLLSGSVFTATTTLGDVQAEVGAGLLTATWADFGTVASGVPGAITVSCRFTCTGANCSAATQGSVTFYVEGVTYP